MSAPAIACRELVLDYGRGTVIGPLTLEIPAGACVAQVGETGAGKTSFIHMVLGLRPPTRGQASLFGEATTPSRPTGQALPDVPQWTEQERLAKEKEVIGFFISGHPLERFRAEVEVFGSRTTAKRAKGSSSSNARMGIW